MADRTTDRGGVGPIALRKPLPRGRRQERCHGGGQLSPRSLGVRAVVVAGERAVVAAGLQLGGHAAPPSGQSAGAMPPRDRNALTCGILDRGTHGTQVLQTFLVDTRVGTLRSCVPSVPSGSPIMVPAALSARCGGRSRRVAGLR